MGAAFWVYISTFIFVVIVVLKSRNLIIGHFSKQQQQIIDELRQSEDVYQKAQNFYEEYRKKMEALEIQAEHILKEAHDLSKEIEESAEQSVKRITQKKEQEFSRWIESQKQQTINQLLSKYAGILTDTLEKDVQSDNYNFTYTHDFDREMVTTSSLKQ